MNVSQFHEAYSNGVGQVSVSVACFFFSHVFRLCFT